MVKHIEARPTRSRLREGTVPGSRH